MDRERFKTKELNNISLPPMYIMRMIGLWYNQEELHWIQHIINGDNRETNHYAIKLKHIVASLE